MSKTLSQNFDYKGRKVQIDHDDIWGAAVYVDGRIKSFVSPEALRAAYAKLIIDSETTK